MDPFWQIIPKITSPLAALSFLFYVFYLFKQSSDRKKEKTLSVGDPMAQQNAVKLILKDYPDIEIDPIRDPAGALKLATEIVNGKLTNYQKTLSFFLALVIVFAFTYLLSLVLLSGKIDLDGDPKIVKTWAELKAEENKLPYPLLSVVCHITLKDNVLPDSSKVRTALFRYHYTLKALRPITPADAVFAEQFMSTNMTNVHPWPGSELQKIESVNTGSYWVKFGAEKEEIVTVTTGANFQYAFPLIESSGKAGCFTDVDLAKDEWLTCYNNTADYIDKITIIVEGDNVDVTLPPESAHRKGSEQSTGDGSCRVYSTNNKCTLVAKWAKLGPGDCVGFKIRWSL